MLRSGCLGSMGSVPYPSDLTDEQWRLLEPFLVRANKRGPKHGGDLRLVVDGVLCITRTGCQWRYLPESFGPWTRVWSRFRRWSRNGTWAALVAALHEQVRLAKDREATPSMVVIDSQLARGASQVWRPFTTGVARIEPRRARSGWWRSM